MTFSVKYRLEVTKSLLLSSHQCFFCISDPPEIEVDQSWISTGDGIEAEVSCNIHAEPPADVSVLWFRKLFYLT